MKATLLILASIVSLVSAEAEAEAAPGGYHHKPTPPCTTTCPPIPTTIYVQPTAHPGHPHVPYNVKRGGEKLCPPQKACEPPHVCLLFLRLNTIPCDCPLETTVTGCPTACTSGCHNDVWMHPTDCPKPQW